MKKYNKLIVAKKLGMTSYQSQDGSVIACTVLSLDNCKLFNVSQDVCQEDGYSNVV